MNNLPYVAESIIVQQNEKLVGLVYPDFDDAFAHGLKNEDIEQIMEENRVALNDTLPAYSQISKMKTTEIVQMTNFHNLQVVKRS